MMMPTNDNGAGAKGRAIRKILAYMRDEISLAALDEADLLELSDDDIEMLMRMYIGDIVHVPFRGKIS